MERKVRFLLAMPFAPSSFLLLVVRPGAPSSVLFKSQLQALRFMNQKSQTPQQGQRMTIHSDLVTVLGALISIDLQKANLGDQRILAYSAVSVSTQQFLVCILPSTITLDLHQGGAKDKY